MAPSRYISPRSNANPLKPSSQGMIPLHLKDRVDRTLTSPQNQSTEVDMRIGHLPEDEDGGTPIPPSWQLDRVVVQDPIVPTHVRHLPFLTEVSS